jgi:hypothetical protein
MNHQKRLCQLFGLSWAMNCAVCQTAVITPPEPLTVVKLAASVLECVSTQNDLLNSLQF